MQDAVLSLNAGSSSIKFGLFELCDAMPQAIVSGQVEGIGERPHFVARDRQGGIIGERRWEEGEAPDHEALLQMLLDWATQHLGGDRLVGVGHRVVHGGERFTIPVQVSGDILQALDALTPLAPLHQPHCLAPIRAMSSLRPALPQVACFDTAFHHTLPAVATRLALPRAFATQGVRRYGFHGLSYEFIARTLQETMPSLAKSRVVVAHLGSGASLCALQDGRSIDTTMGFTALDGLVMGTRCGDLDPGVVLYLMQQKQLGADEIADLLYHKSGLLGVSGLSADIRELLASAVPAAREAVELFVFRLAREVAAMTSSLQGLDGLVFTAGIGEHAAAIREMACQRLGWLGVEIDRDANAHHAGRISTERSRVAVHVVPTDEEAMIARHTIDTLRAAPASQEPAQ